jgi:DNA-binding PucR family transcriptional regulator
MTEPDHGLLEDYQRRTRELAALYETAGDLSALRDVDQVLSAIVRRSRQLLGSDVAYLMLLDDARGEAYMRVTEGTITPDFMSIRLTYGEGLGGLVAKTGMPQWTNDYVHDPRFAQSIDAIVRGESLMAILGVPLKVGSTVTGVLFASDRRGREYTHGEVALLSSLASHAAIALENASLFEESRQALEKWQAANRRIEEHNRVLERAAHLHEQLTELVLTGASLSSIAATVATAIGGRVLVLGPDGEELTPTGGSPEIPAPELLAVAGADPGGSRELHGPGGVTLRIAPAQAGTRLLGYLVYAGPPLADTDIRSLERAALVTALLLLDLRAHDEARSRVMGELFAELVELADRPLPDDGELRRRADASGLALPDPPYVVLAGLDVRESESPGTLGQQTTRLALAEGGLSRIQGNHVALILHGGDAGAAAREVAGRLSALGRAEVTVGGVGPFDSLVEAAAASPRALTCAKVLATIGRFGAGATPEQLGVYTVLFSEAGRDQIEDFVAEAIGPLVEYDATRDSNLVPTLEAYFDVGGQTGKTAEVLFVHVNTLYQRLERIDRLIGEGWRRGEQSLQVHLAVRLARLLRHAV